MTIGYSELGVLSKDGIARPFDAKANGYARSEGYGCVILKRLSSATRDHNPLLAVVKGSATNTNGDLSAGLIRPSQRAQANLIREAWENANLKLTDVSYVEAHGTGTVVGDAVEAEAIGTTFGRAAADNDLPPVPICSLKGNLGHMEPAAGMGSLIKACLMIQHRQFLPQANFISPSPDIDTKKWHIQIPTDVIPVDTDKNITIAINAFGFGGSNSHCILQEPPTKKQEDEKAASWQFDPQCHKSSSFIGLPLSAANLTALKLLVSRWASFTLPDVDAAKVIARAALHRSALPHRAFIVASSYEEFVKNALSFAEAREGEPYSSRVIVGKAGSAKDLRPCLLFSGQGPQYVKMGRELFQAFPVFRDTILKCDSIYRKWTDSSFLASTNLFLTDSCTLDMSRVDISQPAICYYQIGVYELLRYFGITPRVVIGHSLGEIAAAYASGRMTMKAALRMVMVRSVLQQRHEGKGMYLLLSMLSVSGSMIAVACSVERALGILLARRFNRLVIAAINGPKSVTIAGDVDEIISLRNACKTEYDIQSSILQVRCAYHSFHMDLLRDDFHEMLSNAEFPLKPTDQDVIPFYSSTLGRLVKDGECLDVQYWWENLRNTVNFYPAMEELLKDYKDLNLIIEIASRPILASFVSQAARMLGHSASVVSSSDRTIFEEPQMWSVIGACYVNGVPIDWPTTLGNDGSYPLPLPITPFNLSRHFIESRMLYDRRVGNITDRLRTHLCGQVNTTEFPWILSHKVGGVVLFPGTGYIELVLEAINLPRYTQPTQPAILTNISFLKALSFDNNANYTLSVNHCEGDKMEVESGASNVHFSCTIGYMSSHDLPTQVFLGKQSVEELKQALSSWTSLTNEEIYKVCDIMGFSFGPDHALIRELWKGEEEDIFILEFSQYFALGYRFHPSVMDACVHGVLVSAGSWSSSMFPVKIDELQIVKTLSQLVPGPLKVGATIRLAVHSTITSRTLHSFTTDITVRHLSFINGKELLGPIVIQIWGLVISTPTSDYNFLSFKDDLLWRIEWQEKAILDHYPPSKIEYDTAESLKTRLENLASLRKHMSQIKSVISLYAGKALQCHMSSIESIVNITGASGTNSVYTKYRNILHQLAEFPSLKPGERDFEWSYLTELLPFFDTELAISKRICCHLPDLLHDNSIVADLMYEPQMLIKFFRTSFLVDPVYASLTARVGALVDEHHAKNPKRVVRILEIGLRTGGLAKLIATRLEEDLKSGLVEFHSTDLTTTFFAEASEYIVAFPKVKLKRFNIEESAIHQQLEVKSYDIIVIMSTLHGVTNLPVALDHIESVLVPGGTIINAEPCASELDWLMDLWFASMEVWWRFNDFRGDPAWYEAYGRDHGTCWMSHNEWLKVFESRGYYIDDAEEDPASPLFQIIQLHTSANEGNKIFSHPLIKDRPCALLCTHDVSASVDLSVLSKSIESQLSIKPTAMDFLNADLTEPTAAIIIAEKLNDTENAKRVYDRVFSIAKAAGKNISPWIFVTQGAIGNELKENLFSGFFLGFSRSLRAETTASAYVIDLDPTASQEANTAYLIDALLGKYGMEDELIFRQGHPKVPRVHHYLSSSLEESRPEEGHVAYRLESNQKGTVDGLEIFSQVISRPLKGQIELKITYAALNFKDVLMTLNLLSSMAPTLGFGCVGTVNAVGEGVDHLEVGNFVIALIDNCFATSVICDAASAVRADSLKVKPEILSCITMYATALESLVTRARITTEDTVLIHSAASGVGQCAIQLAKAAGAIIIATAGTLEKHKFLKSLGVDMVTDSRNASVMIRDIEAWTKGKGVSVVLNCLVGEAKNKTLAICAPNCRFVDIGKRDMLTHSPLDQFALLQNITYYSCQLDLLAIRFPEMVKPILEKTIEYFENGTFKDIEIEVFPLHDFKAAIQKTSKGETYKKVVFDIQRHNARAAAPVSRPLSPYSIFGAFSKNAFLVTGGLGGIGLNTLRMMALCRAPYLILVGRRPESKLDKLKLHKMEGLRNSFPNTQFIYRECDVGNESEVNQLFEYIHSDLQCTLKGIFHFAGVIQDGAIQHLSLEQFRTPFSKLWGSWNLHKTSLKYPPLDFFVVTTSSNDFLGFEQSNYISSNTAVQQLMTQRRQMGLAGVAVSLFPVLGCGMMEENPAAARYLASTGIEFINMDEVSQALFHVATTPISHVPAYLMCGKFQSIIDQELIGGSMFSHLRRPTDASAGGAEDLTPENLLKKIRKKAAEMFCLSEQDVDTSVPLLDIGLDSLTGIELIAFTTHTLKIKVSMADIITGASIDTIVAKVLNM